MRFPEFNDEWYITSFKEISKINQGLQIAIKDRFLEPKNNRYFYITNEFLKENSDKKYYIENPQKSVLCNENDILMTRTGNTGQVVTNVSGAFHNNFFKIDFDHNKISKDFLYYILISSKIQHKIIRLAGSSTIPDLNHGDFYNIKIKIPSFKEQQKISSFICFIDKKIILIEKKLSVYQEFKKYLLQNIFAQKLRFDNNCNYKNKRVRDFLVESKIKGIDDIHKRLTVKLNLKGIFPREVKTTEVEGATKQFIRKSGQFIYGKQNLHKGAFGIIPQELDGYLSSSDIPSFDFKKGMDPKWFYYYFSRKSFYENLEKLSTGTGSKRISPKDFLNIKIRVPDLEEQKKISSCLFTIDNKIGLIEGQISLMEDFKRGLLQSLFV